MRSQQFWDWFNEKRPMLGARGPTFARMFEHLDQFDRPVWIVETGCTRREPDADAWKGDGCSTILFDQYVKYSGGSVHSVDIDQDAVNNCEKLVSDRVYVLCRDSVKNLRSLSGGLTDNTCDLLYLDSYDLLATNAVECANHHLNELLAALPLLRPDTLVVVDDSPYRAENTYNDMLMPYNNVVGKGMFVDRYAQQVRAEKQFSSYQTGWTCMVGDNPVVDDLAQLVEKARAAVEAVRNDDADELYRTIVTRCIPLDSGLKRVAYGEACLFWARIALGKARIGTAVDWYREALSADARAVDYRLEMAHRALIPMGNARLAQQEAQKAARIEPNNPNCWRILGGIEHELHDVANTIAAYDRQLELIPDDPNALLDRCTIALDVADYSYVREACAKILKTDRAADAMHVLAMVMYREGQHEEAIDLYQKAIDANCHDQASAHWNRSLALHSIGRYVEGWQEHEHRKDQKFNAALSLPLKRFDRPLWKGEPPPASIHIHHEAGMGDNIAMMRYLPLLMERGYDVRYETHDKLMGLARSSFPGLTVVEKAADYPGSIGLKDFDYHLPVGSLPDVFKTSVETVPWNGPYIHPDPDLVEKYRAMLGFGRKIGLCWSSGIREGIWLREYGLRKSMPFATLLPIIHASYNDLFISLQIGPERKDRQPPVIDIAPDNPGFDETAALIANLDLVITVDTSIAHLAGAMGKPVWLMMHTEGSWHWMAERPGASWNEASPWYPSVRIFRQREPHKWEGVIDRIAKELQKPAQRLRVVA